MALPAGAQSDNTEMVLGEIKEMVKVSLDNLIGINLSSKSMQASLNTMEAKAELDFEQMQDAEPEDISTTVPDGDKVSEIEDMGSKEAISLLTEIRDATKLTTEYTKTLADAEKEKAEDVLDPNLGQTDSNRVDAPSTGGDVKKDTKTKGSIGLLAALLGGVIGTIAGIFAGWLKALKMVFNRGFIKDIGKAIGSFFKSIKNFFSGGALSKGFEKLRGFFKSIGDFFKSTFKITSKIGSFFKSIVGVVGKVASVVSKLFAPLLIFLGLIETVKGFFEGFVNTEGSFLDKLMGGIGGAITGFLDFLIAAPLNLIKGLIGWIAGLLGFEGVKEKLESFDFSFGGIVDAVMGIIKFVAGIALKILKFPIALAAGIAGGIAALLPGGLSPKEGFMKGFNMVMGGGDEPKTPQIGEAEIDANKMGGDNMDDGTDAVVSKTGTDMDSSSTGTKYPFKLSGFDAIDDRSVKHDEYEILGKNKKGQYRVKDPDGNLLTATNPVVGAFIDNAIEGRAAEAARFGLEPGETVDISGRTMTGGNIADQSSDLEAQRSEYRGGFMSGPVIAPVTTSSSSVNNSSTLTQVVANSDDSLNGRMATSSGIDPN